MSTATKTSDFDLDSNESCFFCLNQVISQLTPSSVKHEVVECGSPSPTSKPSLHPIHQLSQYLGMDKVFKDSVSSLPGQLLSRVKRSRLNVQLCPHCASLNKEFYGLYRKLDKIQMEIMSCVNHIKDKLMDPAEIKSTEEPTGKLEIFKELRMEAKKKCSQKLATAQPQVKLKRMNMKVIRSYRPAVVTRPPVKYPDERNHCKILDHLKSAIKVEDPDFNSISADDDDYTQDYFEDPIHPTSTISYHQTDVPPKSSESGVKFISNERLQKSYNKIGTKLCKGQSVHERVASSSSKGPGRVQAHGNVAKIINKGNVICKVCGKKFSRPDHCQRHAQSAHKGVKFFCTICNQSFSQKPHLNLHTRVRHFGQAVYKCDNCGRVFEQRGGLRRHARTCRF